MALTIGNVIFYGDCTIDLLAATTSKFTRAGLNVESLSWEQEVQEGNLTLEDGQQLNWVSGRTLTVELTISEISTADMANMELADNMTIVFAQPSKTVTIADNNFSCISSISGGKTKMSIKCSVDSTGDPSDLFTLS